MVNRRLRHGKQQNQFPIDAEAYLVSHHVDHDGHFIQARAQNDCRSKSLGKQLRKTSRGKEWQLGQAFVTFGRKEGSLIIEYI